MAMPIAEGSFNQSNRLGYTLLELMITLAVMAGMVAVAWPSLTKPLTQSELKQAAWIVRDAIAESKRMANDSGEPVFCILRNDSQEIVAGNLNQLLLFLEDSPLPSEKSSLPPSSIRLDSNSRNSSTRRSAPLRKWIIPADVKVESWRWSSRPDLDDEEDPSLFDLGRPRSVALPNRLPSSEQPERDSNHRNPTSQEEKSLSEEPDEPQRWVLTLLPDGRSPDATITLWSEKASRSVEVAIQSATGMIEVRP